jgi:hypothetical protein
MARNQHPENESTGKWAGGVFLASFSALWGLASLVSGRLIMPRRREGFSIIEGPAGRSLSLALIACGLYLHFHYFWGANKEADHISILGRWISGLIAAACLIAGLWLFFAGLVK